ncbi:MAG TPA: hypothetical protein VMU51_20455 [Mycobacteriales bacterium]|nr:hypothetical protein [Mycobacteriales bacterium]
MSGRNTFHRAVRSPRRNLIRRQFWAKATGVAALVAAAAVMVVGTPASAATTPVTPAAGTAAALPFNINGPWTDNGSAKPVISAAAGVVLIDMSYARRPTAQGVVLDATTILVTFPDAGPFIGTFLAPAVLQWSNGSVWQKVYTGPTVVDLNGRWSDGRTGQMMTQLNGFITVNMSGLHRPNAVGYLVGPAVFIVSFPDDRNTTFATLQPGPDPTLDRLTWSNSSQWHRVPIEAPPGNPQCLLPGKVLC